MAISAKASTPSNSASPNNDIGSTLVASSSAMVPSPSATQTGTLMANSPTMTIIGTMIVQPRSTTAPGVWYSIA